MTGKTRVHIGELLEPAGLLDLPAVEIGVWEGDYATTILEWGVPLLYLVDLWKHTIGVDMGGYPQEEHDAALAKCLERVEAFDGEVKVLKGWSHEMAEHIPDGSLGFCYIDASHDYENVKRDLETYWPKLVENGMMAGHDYPMAGVKRAVNEFAEQMNLRVHLLVVTDHDASYWLERK